VSAATRNAQQTGYAPDPEAFATRMRLRLLVEHMDGFLVVLRGRRFLQRHVIVSGDPLPSKGPLLLIGTHYGCGYWFVPYLRSRGIALNIIGPNLDALRRSLSLLSYLYVRMRHRLLEIAAGRPLLYRGNAGKAMREVLAQRQVGFALADMPTSRDDAIPVRIAGQPTRLAQSLFEIAAAQSAPAYIFWSDTDFDTGQRRMHFTQLRDNLPPQQVQAFAAMLDELIAGDPSGWRFWSIATEFFTLPVTSRAAAS
jgi:hypothetical protein